MCVGYKSKVDVTRFEIEKIRLHDIVLHGYYFRPGSELMLILLLALGPGIYIDDDLR